MPNRFGHTLGTVAALAGAIVVACSQPLSRDSARQLSSAPSFRPFKGAPTIPQPGWANVTAGTSDHVCVTVGAQDVYSSGDFAASIGRSYVLEWQKHSGPVKLGWIPRDPTQGPLRVRGERDGGGMFNENLGFAYSWLPSGNYFWPDAPKITHAGRWTLRLTAGHESACFVVEL